MDIVMEKRRYRTKPRKRKNRGGDESLSKGRDEMLGGGFSS
jgi:hypothetical protein